MIVRSIATLSVDSDTGSAAAVSKSLGLVPTNSYEIGDPTRNAMAGRPAGPSGDVHRSSHWSLKADEASIDPDDETGFGALRVLVDLIREQADVLDSLRPEYETIIWWSGFSDSWQGGFVMPADLLADLARLACDLYGTTYLADPEVDDDGWLS